MSKNTPGELAFQKKYNAQPKQVKKREAENKARYQMIKAGKVSVGDKKDVDHIKPLEDGGKTIKGNLRVVTETTNRAWRKGQSGYDPGKQKK